MTPIIPQMPEALRWLANLSRFAGLPARTVWTHNGLAFRAKELQITQTARRRSHTKTAGFGQAASKRTEFDGIHIAYPAYFGPFPRGFARDCSAPPPRPPAALSAAPAATIRTFCYGNFQTRGPARAWICRAPPASGPDRGITSDPPRATLPEPLGLRGLRMRHPRMLGLRPGQPACCMTGGRTARQAARTVLAVPV